MKLRCPACGADISLAEATQAADLQELDKVAAAFGGDWPLVKEYLACFKGKRELKADKLLRLAKEVQEIWHTGRFSSGGAWYEVGRDEFREALKATCNQVTPPLSNHNYLKRVLMAAAEKTSQRRERELRDREDRLMAGGDARPTGPAPLDDRSDDPKWRAQLMELGHAVRRAKTPEAKAEASRRYQEHLKGGAACGDG